MIPERFINAALFFAEKTERLDTIKLYKLLFLADRACIKKTGHTITESTYIKIKPWGPVPKEVKAMVDGMAAGDESNPLVSRSLKVEKQGRNTHISFAGSADMQFFTRKETVMLENLAKRYKRVPGKRIAHGIHQMRGIKEMEWGKDFQMDIFLSPKERIASEKERTIANKFGLALVNV